MGDRVDRWELDISPLVRALEDGQSSVEDLNAAIKEMGETADKATDEAAEGAEEMGDATEEAGGKAEQGFGQYSKGALAAAAAAGAVVLATKEVIDSVIELSEDANQFAKDAKVLDTTAESVQKIQGAFDLLTDGSGDAVVSITRLQRALGEAEDGVETYTDSFDLLGIKGDEALAKFASKSVEEQILAVAAGIDQLDSRSKKTQVAMDLLGRSGAKLVPAFADGGDAIREAMQQIEDAGVVSNETALASEDLQDAILLQEKAWGSLMSEVLTPLIPIVEETTESFTELLGQAQDTGVVDDLSGALARLAESLTDVNGAGLGAEESIGAFGHIAEFAIDGVTDLWEKVKLLGTVIGELAGGYVLLMVEIPKVITGFTTLDELGGKLSTTFEGTVEGAISLKDAFKELFNIGERVAKQIDAQAEVLDEWPDAWGIGIDALIESEVELEKETKEATKAIEEQTEALIRNGQMTLGMSQELVDALTQESDATERSAGERIRIREDEADVFVELEQMVADERKRLRDEETADLIAFADLQRSLNMELASSTVTTWGIISDAIAGSLEQGSAEAKKFAKVQLGITSALTIAEATMNLVAAGASWASGSKTWQEGLAVIGIATGEIVAAVAAISSAESGANFHTGGIIGDVNFTAQEGEAVINRRAVQELGPEGVDRINRGGNTGSDQRLVVVQQTNNRTTFASLQEAIRTGVDPVSKLVQGFQPTQVGLATIGIQP